MTDVLKFLSFPYSDPDQNVVDYRVAVAKLARARHNLTGATICPALDGHDVIPYGVNLTYEEWMEYTTSLMMKSPELHVLMIDGWDVSKGVAEEIRLAQEMGIPVFYDPVFDERWQINYPSLEVRIIDQKTGKVVDVNNNILTARIRMKNLNDDCIIQYRMDSSERFRLFH